MAVVNGTNNPEGVYGGNEDDQVNGFDGNDTMDGGSYGIDSLFGGNGIDTIYVRTDDEAYGGNDGDLLVMWGDNPFVLDGGLGDDSLRFDGGYDLTGTTLTSVENLFIGSGFMTAAQLGSFALVSGYNAATTTGGVTLSRGGAATVTLANTLTSYFGLTGSTMNDNITFNAGHAFMIYAYMGLGNDQVNTGAGNDSIRGEEGNDRLNALNGDDSLDGGEGNDTLLGGAGNDYLVVGRNDDASGGAGDDFFQITTDMTNAILNGGTNVDTMRFDSGLDISDASVIGIETALLNGTVQMTTTQLGGFSLISGYSSGYTSATLALTQGGIASVNLSNTLSSYFQLYGSAQAEAITFNAGHIYTIYAYMGRGDDQVTAATGNDSLRGDEGNDTLSGLGGNDSIDGGTGNDQLDGGAGNDYLVARAGDSIAGGADDDLIVVAENLPAALSGGTGIGDVLRFENNYDITGAALSGIEILAAGGNSMMTATQFDSFTRVTGYSTGYTTAQVSLTEGGTAAIGVSSALTSYFSLVGSTGADIITFDAGYLGTLYTYMGRGNDSVVASSGNDSMRGDEGNDTLLGMAANDSIDGGLGNDSLDGGAGNDVLWARLGDTILGGNNDDLIMVQENLPAVLDGGLGTQDTLRFEGSYDITGAVVSGIENLALSGNAVMSASQLATFSRVTGYNPGYTSATLYLSEGGTATVNLSVTLTSGFSLYGSADADFITFGPGFSGSNWVAAGDGNDVISGIAGNDSLAGNAGDDTLLGLAGIDTLDGGAGNDSLDGGSGNDVLIARRFDTLVGGANDDLISVQDNLPASVDGGVGSDTLRFEGSYDITGMALSGVEILALSGTATMNTAQLAQFNTVTGYNSGYTSASLRLSVGGTATVNLSATLSSTFTLYGSGDDDKITFASGHLGAITVYAGFGADRIVGSNGGDYLRGDGGADSLGGGEGADWLEGSIGADTLNGGAGLDTLVGGGGRDVFVFTNTNHSPSATPDRINDFEAAGVFKGDLIDISIIDADGGLGLNDAFVFGSVALGGVSLIDQGTDTLVQLNTDNDAAFEMVILIADGGVTASTYTASDFIL